MATELSDDLNRRRLSDNKLYTLFSITDLRPRQEVVLISRCQKLGFLTARRPTIGTPDSRPRPSFRFALADTTLPSIFLPLILSRVPVWLLVGSMCPRRAPVQVFLWSMISIVLVNLTRIEFLDTFVAVSVWSWWLQPPLFLYRTMSLLSSSLQFSWMGILAVVYHKFLGRPSTSLSYLLLLFDSISICSRQTTYSTDTNLSARETKRIMCWAPPRVCTNIL